MAIAALRRLPIRLHRPSPPLSTFFISGEKALLAEQPRLAPPGSAGSGDPTSFRVAAPQSSLGILRGITFANHVHSGTVSQQSVRHPISWPTMGASYSSEANEDGDVPTEIVKEHYQNMLKSVEARTMPPNAWLWLLIKHCANKEDVKLLFQILQRLRIFRLSNLRIHANFNCHLCLRVAEACARVGALDYGMKALWKHNVYGLTPSIGSAHYLLLYAKEHNDVKLMGKILQVLRKNLLPLQPGTADIVFSICYNANRWGLISKYAMEFLKAKVKLHRTAYDIWMEFAAKVGDAQSIWKIEKLRSKHVKQNTLASGFSCAKGYLLERNPENAATAVHLLYENLPDHKKPGVGDELQKLVSEWPLQVIKRKKEEREAFSESLKSDILAMVNSLLNMGLRVQVNTEELRC